MTLLRHTAPGATPRLMLAWLLAACPLLAQAQSPVTHYEYDAVGNRTRIVDALQQTTQQTYDALNRLTRTTDPAGSVVRYGYDALDRLVSVTDPRNLVTTYQYNALGDLLTQNSPDTGITRYTHDIAGNVLTRTDAKGQVTTYQYDAANRVTRAQHADGQVTTYRYDQGAYGLGRLVRVEEGTADGVTRAIDYAYDARGRVVGETRLLEGNEYITSYEYANGQLVAMTYPSGKRLDYTRDAQGRISQIELTVEGQRKLLLSAVQYHAFGGVKTFTYGNGQTYTRNIDQDGRTSSYSLAAQQWLIGYDAAGRISFQADAGNAANTATYAYDPADRLTQALLPNASLGYAYDATGNRTSQTVGATAYAYQTDPGSNRLLNINSAPPKNYNYDANGSLTGDGQNQFGYDARGRMNSAVTAAGTTQYRVNALGQRVSKRNAAEDIRYVYDLAGHLLAELDASGQAMREYIWLGDLPVGVLQ